MVDDVLDKRPDDQSLNLTSNQTSELLTGGVKTQRRNRQINGTCEFY